MNSESSLSVQVVGNMSDKYDNHGGQREEHHVIGGE